MKLGLAALQSGLAGRDGAKLELGTDCARRSMISPAQTEREDGRGWEGRKREEKGKRAM